MIQRIYKCLDCKHVQNHFGDRMFSVKCNLCHSMNMWMLSSKKLKEKKELFKCTFCKDMFYTVGEGFKHFDKLKKQGNPHPMGGVETITTEEKLPKDFWEKIAKV